eukprot:2436003-Alexandrium_andersonii.AAC.1
MFLASAGIKDFFNERRPPSVAGALLRAGGRPRGALPAPGHRSAGGRLYSGCWEAGPSMPRSVPHGLELDVL